MGAAERDPAKVGKTQGSTGTRANRTRCQTPSLLRGLIFGSDGRDMSPTHARRRRGQQYRYYVSQSALKGSAADGPAIARISTAEIEGVVIEQIRGLLRQPEVVLGAWRAARALAPDMTEDEARLARSRFGRPRARQPLHPAADCAKDASCPAADHRHRRP